MSVDESIRWPTVAIRGVLFKQPFIFFEPRKQLFADPPIFRISIVNPHLKENPDLCYIADQGLGDVMDHSLIVAPRNC